MANTAELMYEYEYCSCTVRRSDLRDKRIFGGIAFDLGVTHLVDVSPVQVRRNFLDARVSIDRDVDGECGGGCK